ncbi:MAG: hypothetical protein AB1817_14985 [Chloroflexota bacterium]
MTNDQVTNDRASTVGEVWKQRFAAMPNAYQQTARLPFLRKFIRSPFIQLPLRYAGLGRGALQRAIPLPRALRLKWSVQLIGMGRKPWG